MPLTPEQAIEALPTLAGAKVKRQLSAGPVSSTWLLRLGQGRVVLNIDTPLARALGLDRLQEHGLLAAVAAQGLAPAPVAVDAAHGLLALLLKLEGQFLIKELLGDLDRIQPHRHDAARAPDK